MSSEAARAILRVAEIKEADYDRAKPYPPLDGHRKQLAWLIRELRRAAHWAETGHDPGDGSDPHSCKETEVDNDD